MSVVTISFLGHMRVNKVGIYDQSLYSSVAIPLSLERIRVRRHRAGHLQRRHQLVAAAPRAPAQPPRRHVDPYRLSHM